MDGITSTKKIRQSFSSSVLPVIGLTADFRKADLPKYKEIGMNDCIGKPIRLAELKETILMAMGSDSKPLIEEGCPVVDDPYPVDLQI